MNEQYTRQMSDRAAVARRLFEVLNDIRDRQIELQRAVDRIVDDVDALDRFNRPYGDGRRVR